MISLNVRGTPYTNIEVYGVSEQISQTFEAIIDTGFDGFLRIPFEKGIPLALTTRSVGSSSLADDSTNSTLLCSGSVIFEGKTIKGIITLGAGSSILIGTALLKKINAKLFIDYPSQSCKLT